MLKNSVDIVAILKEALYKASLVRYKRIFQAILTTCIYSFLYKIHPAAHD
jgi:hypothetical protein